MSPYESMQKPSVRLGASVGAACDYRCILCCGVKEHPKPAGLGMQGKFCALCYIEEDVSMCRSCSIPWRQEYDATGAFYDDVLQYAKPSDSHLHVLCFECIREDFDGHRRLTLSEPDLSPEGRFQLSIVRRVFSERGPPPIEVIYRQVLKLTSD